MVIIHSQQKLLNTSRLKASIQISQAGDNQYLHSWYAKLLRTGFPGKLLVMYVHEPSLMTVICQGKTIQGTWEQFRLRLQELLKRFEFPVTFIEAEMKLMNTYVVSRTDNKSILAHMNQMTFHLEYDCSRFESYLSISLEFLEGHMMDHIYTYGKRFHDYRTPLDYWKQTGKLQ